MPLPINIEDLLNKRRVESNRIEFKKGWNPTKIYRSICAFANDFDNIGGGYILVGVEEQEGIAVRPVKGIPTRELDFIQQKMVEFNNKIEPFYLPRISVEEVDGKQILAIWVPSGINRPYNVLADVNAKKGSKPTFYVRSGSATIEAKGEVLDELREMTNRTPFDDRGNPNIQFADISSTLLRDHLVKTNSRLVSQINSVEDTLNQMDLMEGPAEKRHIKNVAAMMFCEHPERFFPMTQVEIVIFPEGREQNPNNIIEVPAIKGPVPYIIKSTLDYLRTIIRERIIKPKDDERSIRYYNYPYQALEEAVVNALYHRDYQEREPVEITIEPHQISILSYAGPDRSISFEAIRECRVLRSRRYRNRRLGDFLKELDLTEGRSTGIPTIQKVLKDNGSPKACIETDENRSYFLIDIPCREGFNLPNFTNETSKDSEESFAELLSQIAQVLYKSLDKNNVMSINNLEKIVAQLVTDLSESRVTSLSQVKRMSMKEIISLWIKTLSCATSEKTLKEIMSFCAQTNRYRFIKTAIHPLIDLGWLKMTIPDKPNSSKQKYVISLRGKQYVS